MSVDVVVDRAVRAAKPATAMLLRAADERVVHEMHLVLNSLTRVVAHVTLAEHQNTRDHLALAEADVKVCGQYASRALLRADGLGRADDVTDMHDLIGGLGLVLNSLRRRVVV